MKLHHRLLLTSLVLTLSLGLAPTVMAADPEAKGGLLRGEVTAIADASLTVQTPRAEVTLLTDEKTVFQVPGVKDATLDDLTVGDFVVIQAVRNGDPPPLARHVVVIPNGSLEDVILWGIVTTVDDTVFQLRIRRGKVTVFTDENTVFRIPGIDEPTAADLKEKMPVVVMGQYRDDDQSFHASAVAAIPGRIIRRHVVCGELAAIDGDTLVLTTNRDGDEVHIQTIDETTFRVRGLENATIDDLNVGDRIVALGHKEENEDFIARSVIVVPWRPRRIVVRGEVTSAGDSFLALETSHRGELAFAITDETQFRIPGKDDPGLDDITVGDKVAVLGYKDRDGNLIARIVGKLPENAGQIIIRGDVTAIEGTTLQIETADGPVTVLTDRHTRFRIPGDDTPGLEDIARSD